MYQIPGICRRRRGWIIRWGIMSSPLSWRQLAFSIAAAASCCWGIHLRHSASLPRNLPNTSPVKFADVRFISRMWGASWLSAGPPDSSSHYLFLVYFLLRNVRLKRCFVPRFLNSVAAYCDKRLASEDKARQKAWGSNLVATTCSFSISGWGMSD